MTSFQGDAYCAVHGWPPHVFVHESAHAVAALDRGIAFKEVSIYGMSNWIARNEDEMELGGLDMGRPPSEWVREDPAAASEVLLAGHIAEKLVFVDTLRDSYAGDLRVLGAGLRGVVNPTSAELNHAVGGSLQEATSRTEAWVGGNWKRIRAVASALVGADLNQPMAVGPSDGPWRLTEAEVRAAAT